MCKKYQIQKVLGLKNMKIKKVYYKIKKYIIRLKSIL